MKPTPSPARKAAVMTAATMALSHAAEATPITQTITLSANEAFEQAQETSMLKWDANSGGIALYDRKLVEDDGPGIGFDQPGKNAGIPPVDISARRWINKILHLEHPEALEAHLFVQPGARVRLNGTELGTSAAGDILEAPVSLLKRGDNELIVQAPAEGTLKIKAAARTDILRNAPERAAAPSRSFTTNDAGKTWQPFDGEFMLRLHLLQFAGTGSFASPVLDLAHAEDENQKLVPNVQVESVAIKPQAVTPAGTAIAFEVRSGSTPVFDPARWTDWTPAAPDGSVGKMNRYLQWKAVLHTNSPTISPVLKSVTVEAKVLRERLPAWAQRMRVTGTNNPTIRYTSIAFAYENPNHPKLTALRKKYQLDQLVAGAKSELEIFVKLRHWVASQWKWTPPLENYPDWDADEILTRKYGFCVQHAIVYMQCAIALGYQTRFLFSNNPGNGGHEVCEIWSNDFQKWIYMDPADDFHYVDPKTDIPMSMLEIHDLILRTYFPGENDFVTDENLPNEKIATKELGICYHLETHCTGKSPEGWTREKALDGGYELSRMWTLLRYLPRNNYYSQPDPRPICQGRHWDYSDYIVWQGPKMKNAQWRYRNFTARRSDLEWTLNQVRFDAAATAEPGKLRVQLATVTPFLETFLVKTDRGEWQPAAEQFAWELHTGANRLEMRIRTTSGILGAASWIELDYQP